MPVEALEDPDDEALIIGLVSGSLVDGIDAGLVAFKGSCESTVLELRHFSCLEYDRETQQRILDLFSYEEATVDKLCIMHAILGECFAEAALLVASESGIPIERVDAIGVWGHMMYHLPARTNPFEWRGQQLGSSLQIGDLSRIALRTGVTTIGDLAAGDLAAGGNGCPMTQLFNYITYRDSQRNRVVQNIGGIANGDLVPASGGLSAVFGFDTGPGNMVIDALVRHYTNGSETFDKDGHMASRGRVHGALLRTLLEEDGFLALPPPKAAGRETYGAAYLARILGLAEQFKVVPDDVVATATALTVEAIAFHYEKFFQPLCAIDEVIVGGGGARNQTLMNMLRDRLQCVVSTDEDYNIPGFARESMIVALLANETRLGHINHLPSVTGASTGTMNGVIAPGYRGRARREEIMACACTHASHCWVVVGRSCGRPVFAREICRLGLRGRWGVDGS